MRLEDNLERVLLVFGFARKGKGILGLSVWDFVDTLFSKNIRQRPLINGGEVRKGGKGEGRGETNLSTEGSERATLALLALERPKRTEKSGKGDKEAHRNHSLVARMRPGR